MNRFFGILLLFGLVNASHVSAAPATNAVEKAVKALGNVLPAGVHHGTDNGRGCTVEAHYDVDAGYLSVRVRSSGGDATQTFMFDSRALRMDPAELVTKARPGRVEVWAGFGDGREFVPCAVLVVGRTVGIKGHVRQSEQFCTLD